MSSTRRATSPFRVLVVCTGNVCRSPIVERLLARALVEFSNEHGLGWDMPSQLTVESAGTRALAGHPMTEESAVLVSRSDGDPHGHVARQLDAQFIERAGLVLAVTRDHRRRAVAMVPSASHRIFTLAEFARLLDDVAARGEVHLRHAGTARAALAEVVGAAASRRGYVEQPVDAGTDDVEDPFGRSAATYERVDLHLTTLVASIMQSLVRLDGENHQQSAKAEVR
jgi:protein-tyrosine phosphatase